MFNHLITRFINEIRVGSRPTCLLEIVNNSCPTALRSHPIPLKALYNPRTVSSALKSGLSVLAGCESTDELLATTSMQHKTTPLPQAKGHPLESPSSPRLQYRCLAPPNVNELGVKPLLSYHREVRYTSGTSSSDTGSRSAAAAAAAAIASSACCQQGDEVSWRW